VFAPLGKKGLIVALLAALLAIGAQAGCGPGERTQGPEKSVAPGVVATATIATATATRPSPPAWTSDPLGNARPGEVIHAVRTNKKLIALTFDDGPAARGLKVILAELAQVGGHATFFEVGDRSIGHDALLRRIVRSGHELGDHSYSHDEVGEGVSTAAIVKTIARTQQRFRQATGAVPALFRPRAGDYDGRLPRIAAERHLAIVLWSLHSGDTNGDSAPQITRTVLGGARPGAIVLMHETAPATIEAVPAIVRGLKKKGYRMVTVSELLAAGVPR